MEEFIVVILVIFFYLFLQIYVLPKLGIST